MTNLINLNSYVAPVPIPPVAPNFVFCNGAYGRGLQRDDAFKAGGLLPQGTIPVTYSVEDPDMDGLAANVSALEVEYRLPFLESFGGVSISIDVSGPININNINVVPNDIRGMVAYVADQCLGVQRGIGGFVTKRIQGLVDYVTDPTSDIDAPIYPDSTAFLTVMVSDYQNAHSFPGDYDPVLALFLRQADMDVLSRFQQPYCREIAHRVLKFAVAASRMSRLGTDVPWWRGWVVSGNRTGTASVQLANMTTEEAATARRRKRVRELLP
ncbi:MAG: hypothetical protein ASARMPRED_007079 [Alectoria sarmentosa]|nr:MAG: hypothetical protein ASARMPRED_007079 [Alectoria sarmentosa]